MKIVASWDSPVVAHYGWEIIGGEAFSVDLCCIGPLLMESTVCDHHIHVYWLEIKMADRIGRAKINLHQNDANEHKNVYLELYLIQFGDLLP